MADETAPPPQPVWWLLPLAVAVLIALAAWGGQPPRPAAVDAPGDTFSAGRARAVLTDLLDGVGPHPVGTAAARTVRERLVARLRADGHDPVLRAHTRCVGDRCTTVHNVLVHLPGEDADAPVVLASTHYDSVGAGPGAADAGAGVAALVEIGRILRDAPPGRRGVLLLWNEGEELGLLGARAFVAEDPWADRVEAVVNLEARGTGGRVYLFETAGPSGPVIAAYERHATAPSVSSLYVSIYRMLPNGTDLGIYAEQGWAGANLAFLDGVARYHTPLDDLAHLDDGSLQDLGAQGLAAIRGLAEADLDGEDVIAFDLLGLVVIRWPASQAASLAVGLLLSVLSLGGLMLTRGRLRGRALLGGLGLAVAVVGGPLLLALTLDAVVGGAWRGWPWTLRGAAWALGLAVLALAGQAVRRVDAAHAAAGAALVLAVGALALALSLPGGQYLALVPGGLLLAPVAVGALAEPPAVLVRSAAVLAAVGALLALNLALRLETALGLSALAVLGPVALASLSLLPLAADGPGWRGGAAGGAVGAVLLALVPLAPEVDPAHPRGLEALHVQQGQQAWWLARSRAVPPAPLPPAWADTGAEPPIPWAGATRPAPTIAAEPIRVRQRGAGEGPATLVVEPGAGPVHEVWLWSPEGVAVESVEGRPLPPRAFVRWLGDGGDDGLEVRLSRRPDHLRVAVVRAGLPTSAPPIPPGWVPVHAGHRRVLLETVPVISGDGPLAPAAPDLLPPPAVE